MEEMKPCCSYRQRLESSPTSPMKLLNWNTRTWVWEPRAFQALLMLVRQEDPDVLFLHQTKLDFHPEEVWYALTQMHHHKSSRPDVILEDNIQIQSLLRQYEEAFGKQVNRDKTSICLSQNTSGVILHMPGERSVKQSGSYNKVVNGKVGIGQEIKIWKDLWLQVVLPFNAGGDLYYDAKVSELIDMKVPQCNMEKLSKNFSIETQ